MSVSRARAVRPPAAEPDRSELPADARHAERARFEALLATLREEIFRAHADRFVLGAHAF